MTSEGELRAEIARLKAIVREQASEITFFALVNRIQQETIQCQMDKQDYS